MRRTILPIIGGTVFLLCGIVSIIGSIVCIITGKAVSFNSKKYPHLQESLERRFGEKATRIIGIVWGFIIGVPTILLGLNVLLKELLDPNGLGFWFWTNL